MEKEELIQKYTQGVLSEAEQQEFDALLQNDPEFAKAVAKFVNVQTAITSHEKDVLKSQLQKLEATQGNIESSQKSPKFYKRLGIAVVLLLFFGLIGNYIIQQANTNETLYATYFEPYPNALLPVKRDSDTKNVLTDALYAYEIQEYDVAIEKFDVVLAGLDSNPNTDILFYKAMSLLNLGKETEALNILREIKHRKTKFTPQIYWYGALIHLKFDENDKALKALKYMDSIGTTYKIKKREVLKAKLN